MVDQTVQAEMVQSVAPDGSPGRAVERTEAHRAPGVLHAAFSLMVVDSDGHVLLQHRHPAKTTFGDAWTNSVCSHPRPGESVVAATVRRTVDELGITVAPIEVGRFVYRAVDPRSGLVEHELDHVMVAFVDERPALAPDPQEITDVAWLRPAEVDTWLSAGDPPTTPWLPLVHRITQSYLRSVSGRPEIR